MKCQAGRARALGREADLRVHIFVEKVCVALRKNIQIGLPGELRL